MRRFTAVSLALAFALTAFVVAPASAAMESTWSYKDKYSYLPSPTRSFVTIRTENDGPGGAPITTGEIRIEGCGTVELAKGDVSASMNRVEVLGVQVGNCGMVSLTWERSGPVTTKNPGTGWVDETGLVPNCNPGDFEFGVHASASWKEAEAEVSGSIGNEPIYGSGVIGTYFYSEVRCSG